MTSYDPNFVPTHARFLLGVKVLLVNQGGKILILKRSRKVSRPHGWDFPGGGVDKGEDPSDAAIREVKEETSLDISNPKIISTYLANTDGEDDVIIGYTAKVNSDDVKLLGWEHEEFSWVTFEELKKTNLPSEHTAVVEAYETMKP